MGRSCPGRSRNGFPLAPSHPPIPTTPSHPTHTPLKTHPQTLPHPELHSSPTDYPRTANYICLASLSPITNLRNCIHLIPAVSNRSTPYQATPYQATLFLVSEEVESGCPTSERAQWRGGNSHSFA